MESRAISPAQKTGEHPYSAAQLIVVSFVNTFLKTSVCAYLVRSSAAKEENAALAKSSKQSAASSKAREKTAALFW